MTDQEQYAIVGKTRADYRDAKRRLAALQMKAKNLAEFADKVSRGLANVEQIQFLTGLHKTEARSNNPNVILIAEADFQDLSFSEVSRLRDDINREKGVVAALRENLIQLGGEDPEGNGAAK